MQIPTKKLQLVVKTVAQQSIVDQFLELLVDQRREIMQDSETFARTPIISEEGLSSQGPTK